MGLNVDDTIKLVKELGLPTAGLVAILYMLWVAGKAVGTQMLMPLMSKHLAFMDGLTARLESQENRDIANATILSTVASSIQRIADHPDQVSDRLDAVDRHMKNNAAWSQMLHEELIRNGYRLQPPKA